MLKHHKNRLISRKQALSIIAYTVTQKQFRQSILDEMFDLGLLKRINKQKIEIRG